MRRVTVMVPVPALMVGIAVVVGMVFMVGFMVGVTIVFIVVLVLSTMVIWTLMVVAPQRAATVTAPGRTFAAMVAQPAQFIGLVDVIVAEPPCPVIALYASWSPLAAKADEPTHCSMPPLFGQVPVMCTIWPAVAVDGETSTWPIPTPAKAGAAPANRAAPAAAPTAR